LTDQKLAAVEFLSELNVRGNLSSASASSAACKMTLKK